MLFFILQYKLSRKEKSFLEKLYIKEYKRMWYTAVKILKEKELAEEVIQTTFLNIIKNVSLLLKFDNERVVSKYIFISIKNASLQLIKSKSINYKNIELMDIESTIEDSKVDVEKEVLLKYDIECVKKIIESMNPVFAEALYLKCFLNLEYGEIADLLGIPISTARTRVFRGREILKRATEQGEEKNG